MDATEVETIIVCVSMRQRLQENDDDESLFFPTMVFSVSSSLAGMLHHRELKITHSGDVCVHFLSVIHTLYLATCRVVPCESTCRLQKQSNGMTWCCYVHYETRMEV